jgi:hypothetical protein
MLETLLKLYVMYMASDVRSPMPHLIGPPGCGKSTTVEQLAKMVGVNLHIINVSRLSPLEIEGVQMPVDMDKESRRLQLLLNEMWSTLKEGDIVLWDEFLRGFPEVYNGLLDIMTSRHVRGHDLPKVFMIGASNSAVAYDPALEDRLMHLPVADPRKRKAVKAQLAQLLVEGIGLHPKMAASSEMDSLLVSIVLPMFNVLDSFKPGASSTPTLSQGKSIRNLIGQARLREVQTSELSELIEENNRIAVHDSKPQYVVLLSGKTTSYLPAYTAGAMKLPIAKLTDLQRTNHELNFQLLEMEEIRNQKEGDDATDDDDILSAFDA